MPPRLHRVTSLKLYFIPLKTRVPLKFGRETVTSVTCLRVSMGVADENRHNVEGWGETPLSVQWVWPSQVSYEDRLQALKRFCSDLASAWMRHPAEGHPLEVGHDFQEQSLRELLRAFNQREVLRFAPTGAAPNEPSRAQEVERDVRRPPPASDLASRRLLTNPGEIQSECQATGSSPQHDDGMRLL
jgi:hypothetical protein